MRPDGPAVDLAARVADRSAIDWAAAGSAPGAPDPAVVAQLRVIAALSALHRRAMGAKATNPNAPTASWGSLLLLEVIGAGRFGEVYRAWDPRLDQQFALKLLYAPMPTEAEAGLALPGRSDRAIAEARLLARVRHPNVLAVYGAECLDQRVGIWTEFIEGETLETVVANKGPLAPAEVSAIGLDLARALAAVHEAGVLHRDIKAQNVMREVGGRIVLIDFGTGLDLESATPRSGDLSGTPVYLAPELFDGGTPTVATDLYALAVLLFRLLTGQYPVGGGTMGDVQAGHAAGIQRSVREVRPGTPAALSRVIERGLGRDPVTRFSSARDLAHALEAARRRPRRMVHVVTTVLVLLLVAVGMWAWRRQSEATALASRELLCMDCGSEASVSEDGRLLLYPDTDTGDLAVLDLVTSITRRLWVKPGSWNTSGGLAQQPIWSPDRRQVAYRWSVVRNGQHLAPELRLATTDGHPTPRVLLDQLLELHVHDWSPDGRRVLVSVQRLNETRLHFAWIATASGQETDLTMDGQLRARVSPDGRFIAYATAEATVNKDANRPGMRIHVMAVDGSADTGLVPVAASNAGPIWAPDGKNILYTSNVSGTADLWSIRVADGRPADTPQLMRRNVGSITPLGVLRGGRYIYDQGVGGLRRVVVIPVGGTFPETALERAQNLFTGYRPRWSPDSKSLAFFRIRPSNESADLVIRMLATGDEKVVRVESPASALPLFWFHDGGAGLLEQVPHGRSHFQLFRIDVHTGTARRLGADFPTTFDRTSEGALSIDDKTLYVGASEEPEGGFDRIVGIDLTSGAVRPIVVLPGVHLGSGGLGLAASPDGRWLAIGIGRTRLAIVGVDGHGLRDLPGRFASDSPFGQVVWTADSQAVLFGQVMTAALAGSTFRVWRVPLSGKAPEPVTPVFNGAGTGATFDVSPDGRYLAVYPNALATQPYDPMAGFHESVRQFIIGPHLP